MNSFLLNQCGAGVAATCYLVAQHGSGGAQRAQSKNGFRV